MLICLVDSLRHFVKNFDHDSKCIQISLPKPKVEIGSTKSKTRSLLITITISLNTQIDKSIFRSNLGTTTLANFPSQRLNYTAINLFLQTLSTLTIAKFTISTRTDNTLQTSVKELRAITMCSAFAPDCGFDNSTIILIVDVFCQNMKCSCKLCLQKKTFQSLARNDYQCPQCASLCQVSNIIFEAQANSFSLSLSQGVYMLKRLQNQFKILLVIYCPSKY